MNLDWHELYFGHVSPQEVQEAVKSETWQALRRSIKGLSLQDKYDRLIAYRNQMYQAFILNCGEKSPEKWRMVEVRLTNYVTALSRGGLIKPEDYR